MNFVDGGSLIDIWRSNLNLSVKSAWSHECAIKNVGSVGGCEDDYRLLCGESIHFYEELVEGIVTLVVSSELAVPLLCYSIDFIDENDRRGLLLCFLEKISNSRGTDTDKHFHEV